MESDAVRNYGKERGRAPETRSTVFPSFRDVLDSDEFQDTVPEFVPKTSKHFSRPVSPARESEERRNACRNQKAKSKVYSVAEAYLNSALHAKEKLRLPKEFNFRGKRKIRKLIFRSSIKGEEIFICNSYFGNITDNKDNSIIVDSGTSLHIGRDRSDFSYISDDTVRVRGATGVAIGYKGYLAESDLGYQIPAIWLSSLPVKMLLSVHGLNRDGWSTTFDKEVGNHSRNRRTGKIIWLVDRKNLPCMEISFDAKTQTDESYAVQACENPSELQFEECQYCDEPMPKNIAKGCYDTRKRKRPWETEVTKTPTKSRVSKLLEHQRNCHLFTGPSNRCRCFDCLEMKGRKSSHDKIRSSEYQIDNPFILFSCDFFGQIHPESFRKNCWVLLYCCDCCGYSKAAPLPTKDAAPESLVKFVREVRAKCGIQHGCKATYANKLVFAGIHSDNEKVFRSESWETAVRNTGLHELHSVPFCPQQNGTCERMVGTVKSALRTTMMNVDPRCWDFCAEHISKVWNIKVSKKASRYSKDGKPKCPEDILEQISDNPLYKSGINKWKHLKRFGCLTYFKRDVSPEDTDMLKNKVLMPRRVKGIHLGFSEKNSAWLVGTINSEGRFQVYETVDAVFLESILVRDIVKLCDKHNLDPLVDTSVTDLGAQSLLHRNSPTARDGKSVGGSELVEKQGLEVAQSRSDPEKSVSENIVDVILGTDKEEGPGEFIIDDDEKTSSKNVQNFADRVNSLTQPHGDEIPLPVDHGAAEGSKLVGEYVIDEPKPRKTRAKTSTELPGGVTLGPPAVKRKRGRPSGTKDAGKRHRRTKKQINADKLVYHCTKAQEVQNSFWMEEIPENELLHEEFAHLAMQEDDLEESMEYEIFLVRDDKKESKPGDSVRPTWAFDEENAERPSWVEAKTKEETRLVAYDTWRKLTESEEQEWSRGKLKAVPCALLLNRKRCGRYKARLVVLGNRWENTKENSVYASVVSQTGNRAVVTHCAREGFSIIPFDISNAFVRAEMGDIRVAIRLPESFRDSENYDDGKRILKKALYGLPISPRLWAKTLARDLKSLGYEECKSEPGVYRKVVNGETVAYITVYVDDCIVRAKTSELCEQEVEAINKMHPLTRIQTRTDASGTQHFDMCGADIAYNSEKRTLKISMANYIDKIMKRFDMVGCKVRSIPGFPERNLYNEKAKPSEFKFKAAVGALQWLATTARPDIAHSVNMLARSGANPVNKSMEKCTRLIFRYLAGTREVGLEYSPEKEKDFNILYQGLADHEYNKDMAKDDIDHPVQLFTDASFGVVYKTLRSISGIVVYLHGTPVAWRTKVQTIHTSSTCESEWVAAADGIEFSQSVYGLQNFLLGKGETETSNAPLWIDNRAAVLNARKGVEGLEEIPRKSRHIALRYARVLEHAKRVWFVPTDMELADGLTKSVNREALLQIFDRNPEYTEVDPNEDADEDLDLAETYIIKSGYNKRCLEAFLVCLE